MPISGKTDRSSSSFLSGVIDNCKKQITAHKEHNKSLDNLIKHTRNIETGKGYLRIDENNMPYLKKELTVGTLLIKLHVKKAVPEEIKALEANLKFGKITSREDIILKLEGRKCRNEQYIHSYKELIKIEKQKLATAQESQTKEVCKIFSEENHFTDQNRTQAQEEACPQKDSSFATIEQTVEPPLGAASTSPKFTPRTKREDGSPFPARRTDHEHLDALRIKIATTSKSDIFENIFKMQLEKLDAEKFENNLLLLKNQFNTAQPQPNEGYLRFSNERGLYLSENSSIREALHRHDGGASKLMKKIAGLDLGVGKVASKIQINARIDNLLSKQRELINSLGDSIGRHRTELAFLKSQAKSGA